MSKPIQVLCIKEANWNYGTSKEVQSPVKFGDEYSVIGLYDWSDQQYFFLEGFGMDSVFDSDLFAILPEPSADEMAEAEKESIINIETAIV